MKCWIWTMVLAGLVAPARAVEVKSPDGKVVASVEIKTLAGVEGRPVYSLSYGGRAVLKDSGLGLALKDGTAWDRGLSIVKWEQSAHDSTWKPVCGERSSVRDAYHAISVDVSDGGQKRMRLTVRAYDTGIALCYTLAGDEGKSVTIKGEETEFAFAQAGTAWATDHAQGSYSAVGLDKVKAGTERPLTVKLGEDLWAAVGEARLVDFPRMKLGTAEAPLAGGKNTLVSELAGEATVKLPYTTPWRFVLLGKSPGELLERNDLVLNLNDPSAIADTSWIKPGKVIREGTLTSAGAKACVDFCVDRGLQYIELDAGWYGPERDAKSDARSVAPARAAKLDLQEVLAYAKAHGIGVILYVNQIALERQLDEVLPLYEKWGVKGIKYGFVKVGPQKWTEFLHQAIRKAAEHHLMLDIHDEYRPTGYSRTYPNLMTCEGVRGNEEMPDAAHNCTLLFTRYLCGPADYTICYFDKRIKTTRAQQLAMSVVYFSPWQFLYWYDRPAMYHGEKETDFFKAVPTVWDDTKVIDGQIGKFCTIARRSGREWFVGSMNAGERRVREIPLSFLEAGKAYLATIYSDNAPDGSDPTGVAVRTQAVTAGDVLKVDLAANGGAAMRIVER
jgi:alpha-glucosidase